MQKLVILAHMSFKLTLFFQIVKMSPSAISFLQCFTYVCFFYSASQYNVSVFPLCYFFGELVGSDPCYWFFPPGFSAVK
jgi:hypothetical protein